MGFNPFKVNIRLSQSYSGSKVRAMPNYCFNEITIKGPKAKVMELVGFMRGHGNSEDGELHEFDFNKAVPYPEEFRRLDEYERRLGQRKAKDSKCMPVKDGYNHGGYEWCCDNWGTKWNSMGSAGASSVEHHKSGISVAYYSFDTAWSPCVPVIRALAERFPELHFSIHYKEEGMGFEETEEFN
jgi:hypothetical protein